jgi:predicted SprT family Zn-dependent metalloprotease
MKKKKATRLLSGHKIYLCDFTAGKLDAKRFVQMWRAAWKRIPLRYRRMIFVYWRSLPAYDLGFAPRIVVTFGGHANRVTKGVIEGVVFITTGEMAFRSEILGIMPDEIYQSVLAHELAHIAHRVETKKNCPEWSWRQWNCRELDDAVSGRWFDVEENEVRLLQHEWGFDEDQFCEWENANSRNIDNAMRRGRRAKLKEMKQFSTRVLAAPSL